MANDTLDDLQALEDRFRKSGSGMARPSDLIRLARMLRMILLRLEQLRDASVERLDKLREKADERLDALEAYDQILQARLLVVDELPVEAPYGAIIRVKTGTVAERATIYYGNGPGNPLTKTLPTAV